MMSSSGVSDAYRAVEAGMALGQRDEFMGLSRLEFCETFDTSGLGCRVSGLGV